MTLIESPLGLQRGVSEARFSAMGGGAQVIAVGGTPSLVREAQRHIAGLERAWTRFSDSSELCRLNARAGRPVRASEQLFVAVTRAVEAWRLTGGAFDPTTLDALEAAGYDRSFEDGTRTDARMSKPSPGCGAIELDPDTRTVTAPAGVRIDLGGIGKGLAADLVVTELLRLGADGALVNIGGDMRVAGLAPSSDGWVIDIEDPNRRERPGVCVALADGAVATSSVLEKRWRAGDRIAHHLMDPKTGRSIETPITTATVVAAEAWWAEAMTKAIFVLGVADGLAFAERSGAHAIVFTSDGCSSAAGRWRDILA